MFVSSSDYEGLSNSMLEAMALGIPTICTDCPCGGARMVIKDGENGLLVPVGDKVAMMMAMGKIASDNILAKKLSVEASKIRDSLSADRIIIDWQKVIG
jgi:glycosyltransferase involved in cell wall biosynthesis